MREVLASVERVSGQRIEAIEEPRRAGDPPALVAKADRIRSVLGWRPQLDDLDAIVRTSLSWERQLQRDALVAAHGASPTRRTATMPPYALARPKSLSGLMLLGLALIAVPLLVAIVNARPADPRRSPTPARSWWSRASRPHGPARTCSRRSPRSSARRGSTRC